MSTKPGPGGFIPQEADPYANVINDARSLELKKHSYRYSPQPYGEYAVTCSCGFSATGDSRDAVSEIIGGHCEVAAVRAADAAVREAENEERDAADLMPKTLVE